LLVDPDRGHTFDTDDVASRFHEQVAERSRRAHSKLLLSDTPALYESPQQEWAHEDRHR